MNSLFFIAKNNIKKHKGEVAILFTLIFISALLLFVCLSLMMSATNTINECDGKYHVADLMAFGPGITLEEMEDDVKDIDILFAPHHGRKSGGNDEYLDTLNPKVTLLGNAKSKHLDYSSFNNRGLIHYTNNETGNVIISVDENGEIKGYCTCESFASDENEETYWDDDLDAWWLFEI